MMPFLQVDPLLAPVDRRPGRERWPYLIAESKPHPHSAGAAKPTPEMNVA